MMHLTRTLAIVVVLTAFSGRIYAQNQGQRGQDPAAASVELERLRIQAQREIEEKDWDAKIFEVKYANPTILQNALGIFNVEVKSPGGRLLAVRAPKQIMPAIEDVIKRFDVAPSGFKDAELTIYVLLADDQPGPGRPLPAALQPVVTQLRNVLAYKGYQLVDTLIARGNTNNGTVNLSGAFPIATAPSEITGHYDFSAYFQLENPTDKDVALRLGRMNFSLVVPDAGRTEGLKIATEVSIPRNQQVVVGKATFKDKAFILVMSARFD